MAKKASKRAGSKTAAGAGGPKKGAGEGVPPAKSKTVPNSPTPPATAAEELTPAQKRAAKQAEQDAAVTAIARAIPKRLYNTWSGRQTKVLHDQARRYGMPLEGATIDLIEVVEWIHDFLAENKRDLAFLGCDDDDIDDDGFSRRTGRKSSPLRNELVAEQVEQLRKRNQLLDAKLQTEAGAMVPLDLLHLMLAELAKLLRSAGHTLYTIDARAGAVMAQTLERFAEVVGKLEHGCLEFGDENGGQNGPADQGEPAGAAA